MIKSACLLAVLLLTGCREQNADQPPAPASRNPPAAATTAVQPARYGQSFGSAAVDVITERNKIEAGLKAKAQINAAAARENKEIEAVLNE